MGAWASHLASLSLFAQLQSDGKITAWPFLAAQLRDQLFQRLLPSEVSRLFLRSLGSTARRGGQRPLLPFSRQEDGGLRGLEMSDTFSAGGMEPGEGTAG